MARTLKAAVIGGGMFFDDIIGQSFKDFERGGFSAALSSIGMSHLAPEFADVRMNLTAIGTRDPKRGTAEKIAKDYRKEFPASSIKPYYGEKVYKDILAAEKPDILFVASPDHLHAEAILYALDKGVHVIAEKPLCLLTSQADSIIDLAARKNLVVSVDMHKRYDPAVRELLSTCLAKYEKINRVRAVLEEPLAVSTEIFKWAEHSNPFAYVGCHWLDVVSHYLGVFPKALFATGERNLLCHWDRYVKVIARRQGKPLSGFSRHDPIKAWDSLNVNITYDNGMRADYNNSWINPPDFEGAVNQEIEVYGILGRGFVDQQDRGFREAVIGEGSRTRNPFFGGRIKNRGGYQEVFGYGKASIVAGLLAVSRVKFRGESSADLAGTYPDAASQRSVTMIIQAASVVAERNHACFLKNGATPVTASFTKETITIIEPHRKPPQEVIYRKGI